jgi:uncharacterized protein (TIGR00730 family)
MARVTSLCVYCASSIKVDRAYQEAAIELGTIMAQQGVRLVFGGGRVGLMGLLADAVMAGGGEVVGVIPRHLDEAEIGHQGVTELHIVDNMHVRKEMMFRLADAVAVLPGGLGTLDETFEMITWRQLGLHDKPIVIVDVGGFWQPFIDLVNHVCDTGFASPKARELFATVASVNELLPAIRALPEPKVAPFLDRI